MTTSTVKQPEHMLDEVREIATESLKKHEGFSGYPYVDSLGNLTVGYGRNLETKPFTHEEAERWLQEELDHIHRRIYKQRLPWIFKLDPVRQAVVYEMMYNLGVDGFLKFKKTIQALKKQNWNRAAKEMLDSRWARQVGRRAEHLAEIVRTGEVK